MDMTYPQEYDFYEVYAQSDTGDFDIFVEQTSDIEVAIAAARRYADSHETTCQVIFNDNAYAVIINRRM